jgi:NADH-quinone oxidoreductase subunit E
MIWLIGKMWVALLAAFLGGLLVGAWAFSPRKRAPVVAQPAPAHSRGPVAAAPANLLTAAPDNPDDLTQVIGVDDATAERLNGIGVYTLRQIANWDETAVRWIEKQIDAEDRISRERWVEQAQSLI